MHDALLLGAAAGYLAATITLYRSLTGKGPARSVSVWLAILGAALHAIAQAQHWLPMGSGEVSFLNALSLCALVVVLLLLLSTPTRSSLYDAGLIALPLAAVVLVAEWVYPVPGSLLENPSTSVTIHVVSSVIAFGLLSIAGVYAIFVAVIDHFLRHHHLNQLVRALPALEVLEDLLFKLIAAGFVVLTISLGTGFLFINDMFEQHLVHKTTHSILAWLVFGLLLIGRRAWGWRGRTAVRMTIAGVIILILSYFGSKWVLEVLLGRSW